MSDIKIGSVWRHKKDDKQQIEVTTFNSGVDGVDGVVGGALINGGVYSGSISDFLFFFEPVQLQSIADQILKDAIAIMVERGKSYDKNGNDKERSMPQIVAAFEAVTGIKLTPEQGNKFMVIVKLVRSEQGEDKPDNYIDGAAYMALAGEAAAESAQGARHEPKL